MPGIVELQLGDLFDGPADLIVLPCSTGGTITRYVADRLLEYAIPRPRKDMVLGEIDITPLTGGENIAQFVAFAASVHRNYSKLDAIEAIGVSLGEYTCKSETVRTISAPLLGAGAGGLKSESVVASLSKGFQSAAADGARLTIHILHRSVFDRLQDSDSGPSVTDQSPDSPIRVFVSYSGTSDRHNKWVAELSTFLRSNGIDARLDQWHLRPGMDLPQWMANELDMAERVVIISDTRYTDRADRRTGGVGWETMLIQGNISELPPDSRKYLVIVHEDDFAAAVPKYLKTRFSIHWESAADEDRLRQDLLKELYDVNLAPPIGERPKLYVTA